MHIYCETGKLLAESIVGSDLPILFCALVTGGIGGIILYLARGIEEFNRDPELGNLKEVLQKRHFHRIIMLYTIFVTMISIFPLLGMLGTVNGLLGLDLTNGDMENIKDNFFVALTSTAWGIIFSVIFKVVHSMCADYVESQIEVVKRITGPEAEHGVGEREEDSCGKKGREDEPDEIQTGDL